MQQRAHNSFRRRVLASDPAHVPGTAGFGQSISIHAGSLDANYANSREFPGWKSATRSAGVADIAGAGLARAAHLGT